MMVRRFRMVAGPNGSGKSTLVKRLREDYSVNFYDFLNADDIYASVQRTGAYTPRFPLSSDELLSYVERSTYGNDVKEYFRSGAIYVDDDCVKFKELAVNSYAIALFTNFLQESAISRGESFSQETVFSHPSKIEALRHAREMGYRTYLYYVATDSERINLGRVANRFSQGGHDVPAEKVVQRYARSLAQVKEAIPFLSRAYFFDNSGAKMIYLGQYSEEVGFAFNFEANNLPCWFRALGLRRA